MKIELLDAAASDRADLDGGRVELKWIEGVFRGAGVGRKASEAEGEAAHRVASVEILKRANANRSVLIEIAHGVDAEWAEVAFGCGHSRGLMSDDDRIVPNGFERFVVLVATADEGSVGTREERSHAKKVDVAISRDVKLKTSFFDAAQPRFDEKSEALSIPASGPILIGGSQGTTTESDFASGTAELGF